jgi:hypothetical protein
MSGGRHKYLWRDGHWVELDLAAPLPPRKTPYVRSDIGDYRSVITGEMITSRSQHREHLHAHGCIEVGNEWTEPTPTALPSPREEIEAALQASPETHAEARAASERAMQAIE